MYKCCIVEHVDDDVSLIELILWTLYMHYLWHGDEGLSWLQQAADEGPSQQVDSSEVLQSSTQMLGSQ